MEHRRFTLVILFGCLACTGIGPAGLDGSPAQPQWFLPSVARQLDAAGRLPGTRPEHATDSEIGADRAGELADKFFTEFGEASEPWWTRFADRPIYAAELRRCRRIDFIGHPYESFPTDVSQYFRAWHGAQWLVRYCDRENRLAVEVYVSAVGLSVSLDSLGEFRVNVPLSNFWTRGIRLDLSTAESSENASRAAFRRSATPVAEIPRMVRLSRNWAPSVISWVVTQSHSPGARTSTMALPIGNPTRWVLRPADSASIETDSLIDNGVTPAVLRLLRRRGEAATSQEMPQLQSQRTPSPTAPSITVMRAVRSRLTRVAADTATEILCLNGDLLWSPCSRTQFR